MVDDNAHNINQHSNLMRKHLFVTLLLTCGLPFSGQMFAAANPEPQSQSQTATIKGTVYDENNEPVIGASVTAKGATKGVMTDAFGNFAITAAPGTQLKVSYVGYKDATVKAANGVTVYLQPTTEVLEQLVVVGYGSQKKANLTGAVSTVDVARVMESRPTSDVTKALQGAVPGLTISTNSGDLTDSPTINIRGVGTLSNGHTSSPLIVVDGVPVDDMSFLNPEDIAEISVLKDAASSSIYGTRAAFGVILITTKNSTTKDRVSVSYTNNFSWSSPTQVLDWNDNVTNLKIAMDNTNPGGDSEIFGMYYDELLPFAEAWQAQHGGKKYTSYVELKPWQSKDNVGDYFLFNKGDVSPFTGKTFNSTHFMSYADWDVAKTMFQAAPGQKHNVSLEGTSGKTHYRLSFGYDSKEDVLRFNPNKLNRYMANASIDTQVFSWLKAGARFSFSDKEYTAPNRQRDSYQYMWRFPSFFEMYGYVYDEEGNPLSFRNDITTRLSEYDNKTVTTQTRIQGWVQAEIIKGLTLQADFTYNLKNQDSDGAAVPYTAWSQWTGTTDYIASWEPYSQSTSYASQSHYRDDTWTANIFATYAKTFNEDHNLKVMAGWTAEQEEYKYFYAKRNGLVDYNLPNLALTNGTNYTISASNTHRATTGFFGRVNYDYKGIYLFEANGRYDGSSRFPENDQWAFFPSFSLGYRFSEEAYFANLKQYISNGKFRASYGHIGNEAVGSNMFLTTASQRSAGNVHWLSGNQKITQYSMPSLVSSSLTWERIVTTDIGLDLGFFNNALTLGFDWFQRDTKDMLGPGSELPNVLGASAPYSNNGELRTTGWELSLGWNHSFGDAQVYANFNIGDARTKISKWNNDSGLLYSFLPNSGNYTEGMYFGDILGFETDRYFTKDDFTWNGKEYVLNEGIADQSYLETGQFTYGPGDIKFKDLNGDGVINDGKGTKDDHGDLKVIGNALPRYEYSFRLGGSWKGFDLDLFFQGVGKRNMWATGSSIVPMAQSGLGTFTNQTSYNVINYLESGEIDWANSSISQDNDYPRMYSGAGGAGNVARVGNGKFNFYPQDKYLLNLAYLRLKNITVGYTLPVAITQKALIQKARIYFSADNLFFLYNGAGKYQLDAEQTTSAAENVAGSNDGIASFGRVTPQSRVLSFGLQVTF